MPVALNHTIVGSRDKHASAAFLAQTLGLPAPTSYGPFMVVELDNGVSLDFIEHDGEITSAHYAFLITETDFDDVLGRLRDNGITFYADPHHQQAGHINTNDGGRGLYFDDPNGHNLEVITRPYGG
ncbi:VOC family protein [soil metagenome]